MGFRMSQNLLWQFDTLSQWWRKVKERLESRNRNKVVPGSGVDSEIPDDKAISFELTVIGGFRHI